MMQIDIEYNIDEVTEDTTLSSSTSPSTIIIYRICKTRPLKGKITLARWNLFRHVLRVDCDTLAKQPGPAKKLIITATNEQEK